MKRIITLSLSILMMFCLSISGFAATVHQNNITVEYSYINDDVKEVTRVTIGSESFTATKIVKPNGYFSMTIEDENTIETFEGQTNYDMFKGLAEGYIRLLNTPMYLVNCDYYLGSQYRHLYMGSTSNTVYRSEMEAYSNALTLYSSLAQVIPTLPGAVVADFASNLYTIYAGNMPYKVIFNTDSFEVTTSYSPYDYLFHCYHEEMLCYNENNVLENIYEDTVQVIGG